MRKTNDIKWEFIFLTLALAAYAVAGGEGRPAALFFLGRPLGAALLGLFLVAQLSDRDSALLDEQNRAAAQAQNEPIRNPRPPKNSRNEVATHPVPTMAHTH